MEICDFTYHRPGTVEEACQLGVELGAEARYLAGGTELLADLKQQRDFTPQVISLVRVPGLERIHVDEQGLHIGATARLSAVAESGEVARCFPALAEAVSMMAARQIRQRATLGGNFCGGVPSADTPPICIAGEATVRIASTTGVREIAAEDFFEAPRKTALRPGEILLEIVIPPQPDRSGARYERFSLRKATALAVVGVAARVCLVKDRIASARIAVGAAAPVPWLAREAGALLADHTPGEAVLAAAASKASEEVSPISDLRGSAEGRRSLVETLTRRALEEALDRAG